MVTAMVMVMETEMVETEMAMVETVVTEMVETDNENFIRTSCN
jgi:hypothetical protein